MKYEKYYNLIKEQSEIFDKTQNCQIGQTWKFHLLPVIQNACMLAEKYGANKDVVEVAAIFHDYADLLDFANRDNHHILGAELAEGILLQDGHPQEFIDKVKLCIKNHRASIVNEKFSKEEICVADADAMSHLDSVVLLRYTPIPTASARIIIECATPEPKNRFLMKSIQNSIKQYL